MAETRSRRGIFRRLGGRKSTRASAQAATAQKRDLPTYRSSGHSENEIWVANIDAETGAKYYTNTANGVRSWERPTGRVSVVDGTSLESAVVSAAVAVEPESTETGQGTKASELEPRISAIQPVTLNKSLRDLREQNAIFDAQRLANARVKTIDDILNLLGLSAKIPVFHSEGIDLAALFYVTDQSLQELGLTLGERIKLLKVVELLREMPELSNYSRPLTASNIPVNPTPAPLPSPKRKSHRSRRRRHSSSTDTDSEFEEAVLEALGKRRSRRRRRPLTVAVKVQVQVEEEEIFLQIPTAFRPIHPAHAAAHAAPQLPSRGRRRSSHTTIPLDPTRLLQRLRCRRIRQRLRHVHAEPISVQAPIPIRSLTFLLASGASEGASVCGAARGGGAAEGAGEPFGGAGAGVGGAHGGERGGIRAAA